MSGLAFYSQSHFVDHLSAAPTPVEDIPVTGLEILGSDSVYGMSAEFAVSYIPASTTQKGVIWTVMKGSAYAAIAQTGLLTVIERANNNEVVIRATSRQDSSVYAEKTIRVTYYGGGVSDVVQSYCDRVLADGGVLFHDTAASTQGVYSYHKSLLGVDPKLDFLGYKTDVNNNIIKLYSIDSKYDCASMTDVILQDGILATNTASGLIKWPQNFVTSGVSDLAHLYYEGPTEQSSFQDSIFIANILTCSHSDASKKRTAIFHQAGLLNVQYAYVSKDYVNGFPAAAFSKFTVAIDPAADTSGYQYVTAISVDDVDVFSQQTAAVDYWGGDIGAVSYIKIYAGFKLCIAG